MKLTKCSMPFFMPALYILFISCSSTPPKKFIVTSDSYRASISEMNKVAVINEVMLYRKSASEPEYLSVENSLEASSYMLDGASNILTGKGYAVVYSLTPYICGSCEIDTTKLNELIEQVEIQKEEEKGMSAYQIRKSMKKGGRRDLGKMEKQIEDMKYVVKLAEGEEATVMMNGPFYSSTALEDDPEYAIAIRELMEEMKNNIIDPEEIKYPYVLGNLNSKLKELELSDAAKDNLSIVRNRVDADYLLVMWGGGRYVTGAEQAVEVVATTGCLTLMPCLGILVMSATDPIELNDLSYMDTKAGLIDIRNSKIIWANSYFKAGDTASKKYYDEEHLGKQLFYHLPARKM